MRLIWYLVSVLTILFILFSNPKANNVGNLAGENQLLASTRSTEKKLQIMTTIFVICFFVLTISISVYL